MRSEVVERTTGGVGPVASRSTGAQVLLGTYLSAALGAGRVDRSLGSEAGKTIGRFTATQVNWCPRCLQCTGPPKFNLETPVSSCHCSEADRWPHRGVLKWY